nr:T cell receptor beta variable 3-1 [Pipistrellus kuhlii]
MGSRLLCCVALCFLGAGSLDTAVFQTPKYLIARVGDKKSLNCEQKLNHDAMYWYKQDSKKLLKIMFSYNNKALILNETIPSRFLPKSSDKAHLKLQISSLEPGDSAVYLCASSQDTALQSHCLPVHKPAGTARKLWEQHVHPTHPAGRPLPGVSSVV